MNILLNVAFFNRRVRNRVPIYLTFGSTDCYSRNNAVPGPDFVRRVTVDKRVDSRNATSVFIHPSYIQEETPSSPWVASPGDIALIRLGKPVEINDVTGLVPICFQKAKSYTYNDCAQIKVITVR